MSFNLIARLGLDTREFQDGLNRARVSLSRLAQTNVGSPGAGTAGTIAAVAAAAATATVMAAANAETLAASFRVLIGDAKLATTAMSDLTQMAAKTPFELPELAGAGKSLLAFGFASKDLVPVLTQIGDIASGIGAPIGEIAELYGKARVQGTLFAEDINQLTGRGIPVIQELAKQFGVSEAGVKDLVASGKVGFPALEKAFASLTGEGGKFHDMMKEQSATTNGVLSSLKDSFTSLAATIGTGLIPMVKKLSAALSERIDIAKALLEITNGTAKTSAMADKNKENELKSLVALRDEITRTEDIRNYFARLGEDVSEHDADLARMREGYERLNNARLGTTKGQRDEIKSPGEKLASALDGPANTGKDLEKINSELDKMGEKWRADQESIAEIERGIADAQRQAGVDILEMTDKRLAREQSLAIIAQQIGEIQLRMEGELDPLKTAGHKKEIEALRIKRRLIEAGAKADAVESGRALAAENGKAQVLELQLRHSDYAASLLQTHLNYQEQINDAIAKGETARATALATEEKLTIQKQKQDHLETAGHFLSLADLAENGRGKAGRDARAATLLEKQARHKLLGGTDKDKKAAEDLFNKADAIKKKIGVLDPREKEGANFKAALDASDVLNKISTKLDKLGTST